MATDKHQDSQHDAELDRDLVDFYDTSLIDVHEAYTGGAMPNNIGEISGDLSLDPEYHIGVSDQFSLNPLDELFPSGSVVDSVPTFQGLDITQNASALSGGQPLDGLTVFPFAPSSSDPFPHLSEIINPTVHTGALLASQEPDMDVNTAANFQCPWTETGLVEYPLASTASELSPSLLLNPHIAACPGDVWGTGGSVIQHPNLEEPLDHNLLADCLSARNPIMGQQAAGNALLFDGNLNDQLSSHAIDGYSTSLGYTLLDRDPPILTTTTIDAKLPPSTNNALAVPDMARNFSEPPAVTKQVMMPVKAISSQRPILPKSSSKPCGESSTSDVVKSGQLPRRPGKRRRSQSPGPSFCTFTDSSLHDLLQESPLENHQPDKRLRAKRACLRCRDKGLKCDNKKPCSRCIKVIGQAMAYRAKRQQQTNLRWTCCVYTDIIDLDFGSRVLGMAATMQGAWDRSDLDLETFFDSVFGPGNKQRPDMISIGRAHFFEILSTILLDSPSGVVPMSRLAEQLSLADPCAIYRKYLPATDPVTTPKITHLRMLDFSSFFRFISWLLQNLRRMMDHKRVATRNVAPLMLLALSAYYAGAGMFASLSHVIFAAMRAGIKSIWDTIPELGARDVVTRCVVVFLTIEGIFARFWAEMCSEAREHLAMTVSYWLHRIWGADRYDLAINPSGAQRGNTQERNWDFYNQLQRSRLKNLLGGSATEEELEEALERTRIPRGSGITPRQARARYLTELFFDQTGQKYSVEWRKKSPPDDQQWTSYLTIFGNVGDDSDDGDDSDEQPMLGVIDIDKMDHLAAKLYSFIRHK